MIRIKQIGTPIYSFRIIWGVESVYQPSEDSYLLQRHVAELVRGRVLDMGTGSGIQAVTASQNARVTHVVAADINPEAIEAAKKRATEAGVAHKVTFIISDLFEEINGLFDWIIFNPPYLPSEGGIPDPIWNGGNSGCETITRFLDDAKNHLIKGGSILLIYSSETGITIGGYGYHWEILEELPLFFERLYCAQLSLS
jgi:release factor glutamine methyltransferase